LYAILIVLSPINCCLYPCCVSLVESAIGLNCGLRTTASTSYPNFTRLCGAKAASPRGLREMKTHTSLLPRIYLAVGLSALIFSGAAQAQQRTVRACEAEWKTNKAALQSRGTKKKDFMVQCRAGAVTTPAPAAAPESPATKPPRGMRPRRAMAQTPLKAGQFASEAAARSHCPSDTVVWVNTKSGIYHFSTGRRYGNTKAGAYMCERETTAAGLRPAKNEKRPR
jgi:hypothetical protein